MASRLVAASPWLAGHASRLMDPWSTLCHPPSSTHLRSLPQERGRGQEVQPSDIPSLFLTGVSPEMGEQGQTLSPHPEVAMEGTSGNHSISHSRTLRGTQPLLIIY